MRRNTTLPHSHSLHSFKFYSYSLSQAPSHSLPPFLSPSLSILLLALLLFIPLPLYLPLSPSLTLPLLSPSLLIPFLHPPTKLGGGNAYLAFLLSTVPLSALISLPPDHWALQGNSQEAHVVGSGQG